MKKRMLAITMLLAMCISACNGSTKGTEKPEEQVKTPDTQVSAEAGAGDSAKSKLRHTGVLYNVKRDEPVKLQLGYEINWGENSPRDGYKVYWDSQLQYEIENIAYDYDYDTKILDVYPSISGLGALTSGYEEEGDLSGLEGSYLYNEDYDYETNNSFSWGNFDQLYLANYVDMETGEPLDQPTISVIDIETEIESAPEVVFSQTEDGRSRFYWEEVPGATQYIVFKINRFDNGYTSYATAIAVVDTNEWIEKTYSYETSLTDTGYAISSMNNFFVGENDLYDEELGVIAINENGASSFSNLVDIDDLQAALPNAIDYSKADDYGYVESIEELPTTVAVKMCDESSVQKVMIYDTENYKLERNHLYLKSSVYGTQFSTDFTIYNIDENTIEEDLAAIKARQDELLKKGGDVLGPKVEVGFWDFLGLDSLFSPDDSTVDSRDIPIYGNSELSRYLAKQMLDTKKVIDLSDYPEAADKAAVLDAFYEAKNQNPLILGVQSLKYNTKSRAVELTYDYDTKTTGKMQDEIQDRIDEIIPEIITEDMTDIDKEMAINQYLCDNAQYDKEASDNAAQNDYYGVDKEYYDSFTAYGIMVKGKGVCSSYAADFKLLADAAGLECVVVTGMLEGSIPHAWNRVKLDGEWYIVDPTNNDNDIMFNGLFNLSDEVAKGMLVANDEFVEDSLINEYTAASDDKEYYRVKGKRFSQDEIADRLVDELKENGKAMLRTDYDLTEDQFKVIAQKVANKSGGKFSGSNWFGIISLQSK